MSEKLIKSKQRVKDFAEVFTPSHIVNDMCNLIPDDVWKNINSTFLEPACGNGNFLIEIINRKLSYCKTEQDVLNAYKSIYGIDIQQDNVNESIERMKDVIPNFVSDDVRKKIDFVLSHNIICGNSLEIMKELECEQNG